MKTVQPITVFQSWSLLLATSKNNAQETYFFVSDLWFCRLHAISLLTLSSIAIEGVIGKIKQNELDCRDTAPFNIDFNCLTYLWYLQGYVLNLQTTSIWREMELSEVIIDRFRSVLLEFVVACFYPLVWQQLSEIHGSNFDHRRPKLITWTRTWLWLESGVVLQTVIYKGLCGM